MVTTRAASHEAPDSQSLSASNRTRSPRKPSPAKSAASPDRPITRQLRHTKIVAEGETKISEPNDYPSSESGSTETDPDKTSPGLETKDRGRAKKKRNFDELDADATDPKRPATASKQSRKRSTSGTAEQSDVAEVEGIVGSKETAEKSETVASVEGDGKENGTVTESAPEAEAEAEADEEAPQRSKEIGESITTVTADNESRRPETPPPDTAEVSSSDAVPMSPQNKRNREQFSEDQAEVSTVAVQNLGDETYQTHGAKLFVKESTPSMQEPEKKKSRDNSLTATGDKSETSSTKIPPGSGFANISAQSPFAAISTKSFDSAEPQQPQTSTSAFASSGFASFASSSKSPFGSVPPSTAPKENTASPKLEAAPTFASLSGSKSPFASATATSAFGAPQSFGGGSGFGSLSNGFGGLGGKAPVTNWGTNGTSGIIGLNSKPTKPFGASKDKDEDDEEDGEASETEDNTIGAATEGSKDPRFYEQDVETGEEGEKNLFSSRAKLYINDEKQWKERAVGSIKINMSLNDGSTVHGDAPPRRTARFIMRADGSHRIMLNSPITTDLNLRDPSGGPPQGKNALFMGFDNGKLRMMQLKMKNNMEMMKLYNAVQEVLGGSQSAAAVLGTITP